MQGSPNSSFHFAVVEMLRAKMKFFLSEQGGDDVSSSWVPFQLEDPVGFPEELLNPNILGLI